MNSTETRRPLSKRKPNDTCGIPDCNGPFAARDMCRKHYQRWLISTPKNQRPPARPGASRLSIEDRFWRRVQKAGPDDCWPWMGSRGGHGHGVFWFSAERKRESSHAVALELSSGVRRPPGMHCCHHCDNPPCCNPAHLYYGTPEQNQADMVNRARNPRGIEKYNAVLSDAQVVEIRTRYFAGETAAALAVEFGIQPGHLSNITRGRMWKYVGGPVGLKRRPKLSEVQRAEIRARRAAGASLKELAAAYGISPSHAGNVARRFR